jgi:two-component system sensor histidine kinase KdpD
LADAVDEKAIAAIAVDTIKRAIESEDVVYLPPEVVDVPEAEAYRRLPIGGGAGAAMGTILLPESYVAKERITPVKERFLTAISENVALALSRAKSIRQRAIAVEEAKTERYRSAFLRAVSHDLRTPLMGLIGTSEMILEKTEKHDPRYALAEAIHADSEWLRALIVNLLDLTRLQSGKLVLNKQFEAAEEVVGDAVRRVSRCFDERNIDVHVPDALILVPMDAALIRQVLVNLLENAVKHTPPPKEILVTVERGENREVCFSVADRGEGIDSAALPHIFHAFYTFGPRDVHVGHGVGLGLAICDAVIAAHGGSITAENRADGPGAVFTFTLPTEETS